MQSTLSVALVICVVFGAAIADFRDDALKLHNTYRAKHHSPPLSLCNELNKIAQKYAKKMARSNNFGHSGRSGENIYMHSDTKLTDSQAVIAATKSWYGEVSNYDYNNGHFARDTGHFTQVVWKNSKHLGIGVGRSKRGVYVCANYDPPGNYRGQFDENVLRP